jgi:hypothetical protein
MRVVLAFILVALVVPGRTMAHSIYMREDL